MIVLDTHTLVWMVRDDPALGPNSRKLIANAWNVEAAAVSAITFWETTMLVERGKIVLPMSISQWYADLLRAGLREIPLDGTISILSTELKDLHRDPADRFITATALSIGATLVTADSKLLAWKSELPRQNARE